MEIILKFIARCLKCENEFENYLIGNCELCIDCNYTDTCETSIKKLCQNVNCKKCFYKSFLSNRKSKFWDYTKNNCTPREVFRSSGKKYWFNCNCGHDFKISLNNMTKGKWCPYCCFPPQKLCDDKNCISCSNNSFSSNKKSKYWNEIKNKCIPRDIFKNSNKKYWFNCKCGHDFSSTLNNITNQQWCPYCCFPPQKLCDNKHCISCFNNSFSGDEKSVFWDFEKNNCNPRQVSKSSGNKYWFICEKKHNFEITLGNIINGRWCPRCKYKTESIVFDFLTQKNYTFFAEQKFHWCKNEKTDKYFRFDFYFSTLKIILEIDGIQHFRQVSYWKTPEDTQERDIYKEKLCLENGLTVIRINQEDIFYDRTDWKNDLIKNLIEYTSPTIIYLCSKNNYFNRN